jgi:hypothetical protein
VLFDPTGTGTYIVDSDYSTYTPLAEVQIGTTSLDNPHLRQTSSGTMAASEELVDSATYIQKGGENSVGSLELGNDSNTNANYLLSGGTLAVNELDISVNGTGTLLQTGGVVTAGSVNVGSPSLATGYYSVTNGTATISGQLSVGYGFSLGTLSIGSGGFVSAGNAQLGWSNSGTILINAGGEFTTPANGYVTMGFVSGTGTIYNLGTEISPGTIEMGFVDGYANYNLGTIGGGSAGVLSCGTCAVGEQSSAGFPPPYLFGAYFTQNSGVATFSSELLVGLGTYTGGVYTMNGGQASAAAMLVGGTGTGAGQGTVAVSGGSITVSGALTISSTGTINLSGGTMNVQSINSAGTLAITGGTFAITGAGSLGSGSIAASGLSISGSGVLDVGSSGLVIEYGNGTSPVGDLSFAQTARNYPAGSIQRYAQTGFNALSWNGPGIISSYAENDSSGLTAVGVADENDLANVYPANYTVAGGGSGTWMGQLINDPNNVLVRMTWYGDGNLDGVVNKFDVAALAQGYSGLAGYIGWSDGDYTYAGYISKLDISLLAQSYVFQGAPLGDAITPGQAQYLLALDPDMSSDVQMEFNAIAAGQTPEPATAGLALFASAFLVLRKSEPGNRMAARDVH